MSEVKYTKGPWRVGTAGPNGCYTVGTKNGLMTAMVAHSVNYESQKDQAIGNACLIAAAPELLEALQLVVDTAENGGWPSAALVIAKATIAKARGNENAN